MFDPSLIHDTTCLLNVKCSLGRLSVPKILGLTLKTLSNAKWYLRLQDPRNATSLESHIEPSVMLGKICWKGALKNRKSSSNYKTCQLHYCLNIFSGLYKGKIEMIFQRRDQIAIILNRAHKYRFMVCPSIDMGTFKHFNIILTLLLSFLIDLILPKLLSSCFLLAHFFFRKGKTVFLSKSNQDLLSDSFV